MTQVRYRGRFAPSPTGPLHFGSLVAAAASYLDTRAAGGAWLVRMEDLDPPREVPGAASAILRTLEAYGFEWDEPVLYQSTRAARYAEVLNTLTAAGWTYPCGCTRKEIGDEVYPGLCARGLSPGKIARATRFRVGDQTIAFSDALQGDVRQSLARDVGDFVLKRADGPFAYQLAVVVDDADQGITHIVHGADLLDSTPRQIRLQQALGVATPEYLHVPIATNSAGEKLSKQTLAPALDSGAASSALYAALAFLGQAPPTVAHDASLADLWAWAHAHWSRARLPQLRAIAAAAE